MRQCELLNLKWGGVNFERGVISVMQTKTMRRKTIAMNEASREALNWLNENRYGDYLFMWPWGDRVERTTVYDAFKQACSAAGIKDFRFHDLRIPLLSSCYGGRGFGRGEGFTRPYRYQHDREVFSPST
jgi:integrase